MLLWTVTRLDYTYGQLGSEPEFAGGLHLGVWGKEIVWRNGAKFSS